MGEVRKHELTSSLRQSGTHTEQPSEQENFPNVRLTLKGGQVILGHEYSALWLLPATMFERVATFADRCLFLAISSAVHSVAILVTATTSMLPASSALRLRRVVS